MKKFYAHLVEIDSIIVELDSMELSQQEKVHLASLADSTLHNHILDAILSQLSEQDKVEFVKMLQTKDHDKIWSFLNTKIDRVEDRVKQVADEIKKELHQDIKEAKQKKETK